MKLQKDLREFIELLNSHGVEYLIVGGHAVAYHGHPRYTGDIDFFVRPSQENAARVVAAVAAFGFAEAGFDVETFTEAEKVIQLGRPPNRIDILTSISGVSFEDAWPGRVEAHLDGVRVWFIGRTALIANKRAAGRQKDLADIEELD